MIWPVSDQRSAGTGAGDQRGASAVVTTELASASLPATSLVEPQFPNNGLAGARRLYRQIRRIVTLCLDVAYDFRRFLRHSGIRGGHLNKDTLLAEITKYSHMIEKGLALPSPKPGFGEAAVQELCMRLARSVRLGLHGGPVDYAFDAIASYKAFNDGAGVATPPWLAATLELGEKQALLSGARATRDGYRPPQSSEKIADYLSFIGSRRSVRQFDSREIPDGVLENAVWAAQAAPCVCNRQACKVYFIRDAAEKRRVLSHQNGNRGFGQDAAVIALIAVNLRNFLEPGERNQAWIDGGLFSMNFLLGLHAQGVGACCLNWSATAKRDRKFRSLSILSDDENLVMMVAIGAIREAAVVARSERKPLRDVAILPHRRGGSA